jgi:sodium bicarbonate transporter 10
MIGISILLTPVLCHIPLPVLYGVFLYMGVNVLKGIQFTDRLLLFFMPNKYQPDHAYLRRMPIGRVHLVTFQMLICSFLSYGCLEYNL